MNATLLEPPIGVVERPFIERPGLRYETILEQADEPWLFFQRRIEGYTAKYAAMWDASGSATPQLGTAIPLAQKLQREVEANARFEEIKRHLRRFPRAREQREAWREALLNAAREFAGGCLGFPDAGLRLFFTPAGLAATRQFVSAAKVFDSSMKDESLFQALRNLWVVHCIQLLLERELSVSPATFGYSMLYPWTDNYLDDPKVGAVSKLEFGDWLEQRLRGFRAAPSSRHAAQVDRLVARIEDCFPRAEFEEVYLSLRAIHHAQMASLEQQSGEHPLKEPELLHTTLRKGGTSVLADAYLVAGQLSETEADFMFGYGVLLQLMDDLQDFQNDLAQGHTTIFARQAGDGLLDGVTSKLWSFARAVLWGSGHFQAPKFQPIKALIQENVKLLLLQAVARNQRSYTTRYAEEAESCSPFRFSFVRGRAESLAGESKQIIALLRKRRQIDSALDLLD